LIQQKAKILAKDEVIPGVFLLGLHSPQVVSQSQPGQFLHLRVGEGPEPLLRRPLSVFQVDSQKGIVGLLFRAVGRGTHVLSQKKAGEVVDLIGPLGQGFSILPGRRMILLVAGGLGVAPLFFLAEVLMQRGMTVRFLLGAKTRSQLLCRRQLERLGANLLVSTDDGSEGFHGPITQLLEEQLRQGNYQAHSTMICSAGPEPMLARVTSLASQYGISGQISMERHMACGLGACLGCVVQCRARDGGREYRRVCIDGPVFGHEEVIFSPIHS
jgi:dihydroorotate dehydrogenase electron transfer subunit